MVTTRKTNSFFSRNSHEAKSLLQPVKKNDGTAANGSNDDADSRKKQTVTGWKQKRRLFLSCGCLIVTIATFLLAARGYHRRRHNRLRADQRAEWHKFFRRHHRNRNNINNSRNGGGRLFGMMAMRDVPNTQHNINTMYQPPPPKVPTTVKDQVQYLNAHPQLAREWREHKTEHTDGLFEERPEPQWTPGDNPVERAADGLGAAAEVIGGWMQEGVETVLGQDVAQSVGDAVSDTVDQMGDWTDDVGEAVEKFSDDVASWFTASMESVDAWMNSTGGNNGTGTMEEWMNWTSSFVSKTAINSSKLMWNYTTEQEAAMDNLTNATTSTSIAGVVAVNVSELRAKKMKALPEQVPSADGTNVTLDQTMAFVTTNFPADPSQTWRFEKYVIGALKTYLKSSVLFYIVNTRAKRIIQDICDSTPENQEACSRMIPVYVACPTREYGISTCCYQDKGLAALYKQYPDFQYYVYHQDDLYFRTDYLKNYVEDLQKEQDLDPKELPYLLSASPFRSHGQVVPEPPFTPERLKAAREQRNNCSYAPQHIYPWGRPALMYSNAALKEVVPAYRKLAISKECIAFSVPAASASPIVHWMFQLPLVKLPSISAREPTDLTSAFALRQTNKETAPGSSTSRIALSRYRPTHRFVAFRADAEKQQGFDKIHNALAAATKANPGESLFPLPPYRYNWHRPTGFQDTTIFKDFGFAQNWTSGAWKTFAPRDCVKYEATRATNARVPGRWRQYHPTHPEIKKHLEKHGLVDTTHTRNKVLDKTRYEELKQEQIAALSQRLQQQTPRASTPQLMQLPKSSLPQVMQQPKSSASQLMHQSIASGPHRGLKGSVKTNN